MKLAPIVTGLTLVVAAGSLSAQGIQGDAWRLGRFATGFGASAWNYSPTMNLFLSALRRETIVAPVRVPPPPPVMVEAPPPPPVIVQAPTRGPQDIAHAGEGPVDEPDPIVPTTTVPEPATMALLATGLLLLGAVPVARRLRGGR